VEVNWKKGLFRLTIIISAAAGLLGAHLRSYSTNDALIGGLIFAGIVWIAYGALRFILSGFLD
jgi:hypothetical protein